MTAKAKRLKRYHYACNLTSAFLRDVVPDQGGYYVGCRARLEARGDVVWVGHQALPVLVRNRKLKALILMPNDGTPMHGSMWNVFSNTLGSREAIHEYHLKPIMERQSRWDWCVKEVHPGIDYTPVIVDRLHEDLATCSLSDLQQLTHARVNRIMEGVPSNRWQHPRRFAHALTGGWGFYSVDGLTLALNIVRDRFQLLGIEWNKEWYSTALIAQAKRKLTAS